VDTDEFRSLSPEKAVKMDRHVGITIIRLQTEPERQTGTWSYDDSRSNGFSSKSNLSNALAIMDLPMRTDVMIRRSSSLW
jgi:hypothetical protein